MSDGERITELEAEVEKWQQEANEWKDECVAQGEKYEEEIKVLEEVNTDLINSLKKIFTAAEPLMEVE